MTGFLGTSGLRYLQVLSKLSKMKGLSIGTLMHFNKKKKSTVMQRKQGHFIIAD